MEQTKKQKLQAALRAIRKEYQDAIEISIRTEPNKNYAQIGREHGVSEQFVFNVAKERNCGRNTPLADETEGEVL